MRNALRAAGLGLVLLGGILVLVALVNFFEAFNNPMGGTPSDFWLFFLGGPLFVVGLWCLYAGFFGTAARFVAGELAPTVRQTMGYVGGGQRCPSCGRECEAGSRYCDSCGRPLGLTCSHCGVDNEAGAAYCRGCGSALS